MAEQKAVKTPTAAAVAREAAVDAAKKTKAVVAHTDGKSKKSAAAAAGAGAGAGAVASVTSPPTTAAMNPLSYYGRLFLAGGSAASLTHQITVPLDVVKTRMQLTKGRYTSIGHAFRDIFATEGPRGLLRGFMPTATGYFIQGGCKFGFYEMFKSAATATMGTDRVNQYKLPVYLVAGGLAETIASTLLCPFEAIRIRMVSAGAAAPNWLTGLRHIKATEGWNGLYKGLGPILGKQVPYTMTQFAAFQYTNDALYKYAVPWVLGAKASRDTMTSHQQLVVSTAAGAVAGVVSAICSHPPDTVLSRINMPRPPGSPPATAMSCIRELGFMGLWRGISVRCFMVGTISAGMFLVNDGLRVFFGLPPTQSIAKHAPAASTASTATSASKDKKEKKDKK